jgi:hypothetical protein
LILPGAALRVALVDVLTISIPTQSFAGVLVGR